MYIYIYIYIYMYIYIYILSLKTPFIVSLILRAKYFGMSSEISTETIDIL